MKLNLCADGKRHWFTYYGWPGSSSPTCVRFGCRQKNPHYDPERDPNYDPERDPNRKETTK